MYGLTQMRFTPSHRRGTAILAVTADGRDAHDPAGRMPALRLAGRAHSPTSVIGGNEHAARISHPALGRVALRPWRYDALVVFSTSHAP